MKRVTVKQSPIHGKGAFALRALSAGERITEYRGLVTTWDEATLYYAQREHEAHTFLFGRTDGQVIDGGRGGNASRWFNHACDANCEAVEDEDGRVYFEAARDIVSGEELFIDYALEMPAGTDRRTLAKYACHCGGRNCRGTMLADG